MVRNYVRKTVRAAWSAEDMYRAINACKTREMSLRQAALAYKVPKSTLCSRLKRSKGNPAPDVGAQVERTSVLEDLQVQESTQVLNLWSPENKCRAVSACNQGQMTIRQAPQGYKLQKIVFSKLKLNEVDITNMEPKLGRKATFEVDKEAALECLINDKQASGLGLTKQDVCRLAYYFAERNDIQHTFRRDKEMAGRFWLEGFLKRHPQIMLRTGRGLSKEVVKSFFECLDGIPNVDQFNQPLETECSGGELVINRLGIVTSPTLEHHEDIGGWIDEGKPVHSWDERNTSNEGKSVLSCLHVGERNTSSDGDSVVRDHPETQRDSEQEQTEDIQASRGTDLHVVEVYIKEEEPAYCEPGVWNAALSPSQQTTCNETDSTTTVNTPVLDGTKPCKRTTNQHLQCGEQIMGETGTVTKGDYHGNSREGTSQHPQRSDCSVQKDYTSCGMRTHERKRSHCCVQCSKDFLTKSLLDRHIKTHTADRNFQCAFCDKWFMTESNLATHTTKVHTKEKKYGCSLCHKFFLNGCYLKRHLLVHTGEKPHECSQCHMCFLTKQHLKRHMFLHTGEAPFQCAYCSKGFADKDNLAQHTIVHTGEKPFHCSHCMKSFTTNSKLKRHMIKHAPVKPYKCSYCPKFFSTKVYYTRHNILIHTRERPNACSHCPKFFATKSRLLNHMNTHTEEKSSV